MAAPKRKPASDPKALDADADRTRHKGVVDEASEDSFPASDPPAYTPTQSVRTGHTPREGAARESGVVAEPVLGISPEKVCFIALAARQVQAKEAAHESDPASNPSDDGFAELLEDQPDDPVRQQMADLLESLNEEEATHLFALVLLGRGDYSREEWDDAVAEAARERTSRTADWYIAMPMLAEYLDDGLGHFGHSCTDYAIREL